MEAHTGFASSGTARLHVRKIGRGPSIIALHGGPDFDYDYLLPELDRLAERFQLIYYDQRGRGRSADGVEPEDVSLASEIEDVEQVRRHFGLESVAVLGHSWGAVLAMEYASRHPDRVTHLILMNTAPAGNDDVRGLRQYLRRIRPACDIEAMKSLAETAEYRSGNPEVESEYYRIHFRPGVQSPGLLDLLVPRLRANFTQERVLMARAVEQRLYDQTWSSPGYDLLERLHGLTVPTLVLHGEADLIPVDVAVRIADAIPGSRLVVLPSCGHFVFLEAPDAVVMHVRRFLAR